MEVLKGVIEAAGWGVCGGLVVAAGALAIGCAVTISPCAICSSALAGIMWLSPFTVEPQQVKAKVIQMRGKRNV